MTTNNDEILSTLKPGTLAHQLWTAQKAMTKIDPKPKAEKTGEPRRRILAVEPGEGTTNLYSGSMRRKIYEWVIAQPKKPVTIEALEKEFGDSVRGHVQKLTVSGHLKASE